MAEKPAHRIDPTPCTCSALRRAARHVSSIYDRHLASEGLRVSQYAILATLGRLGRLSINELARSMVMDRTTLGRALRPLQRDGLVAIATGSDARTRQAGLTPVGADRLRSAKQRWSEAQADFDASFGADDCADLKSLLHRAVTVTDRPMQDALQH